MFQNTAPVLKCASIFSITWPRPLVVWRKNKMRKSNKCGAVAQIGPPPRQAGIQPSKRGSRPHGIHKHNPGPSPGFYSVAPWRQEQGPPRRIVVSTFGSPNQDHNPNVLCDIRGRLAFSYWSQATGPGAGIFGPKIEIMRFLGSEPSFTV